MKILKKLFLSVLLSVVLLTAVMLLFRNIIAKTALTYALSAAGLKGEVSRVNIGIFKPYLRVAGLTVRNPAIAKDETMIDLPEFYVEYSPVDILNNRLFFPKMRVNLKEMILTRDKNGVSNTKPLESLIPQGSGKPPQWRIDLLELKIGRIVYNGYSMSGKKVKYDINLNFDQSYRNVDNPAKIGSDIFSAFMGQEGKEIFQGVKGTVEDTGKKAAGAVKDTVSGTAEGIGSGVKDVVGGAAKGLKDLLGK
ncbi:MAG: hypothetical protein WC418_04625 [Candidatus Omnitrophota bacterium]|jgi:hypothetical protein